MSLFKKIWKELTRIRSIEFNSFETPEEKEKRFRTSLQKRIYQIQTQNYKKLMSEKLIPFVRDFELSETGLLLSEKQVFEKAHSLFLRAKSEGNLDSLNNIDSEVV